VPDDQVVNDAMAEARFDAEQMAAFDARDVERLVADAAIVKALADMLEEPGVYVIDAEFDARWASGWNLARVPAEDRIRQMPGGQTWVGVPMTLHLT
jgi:hypothetical protein